MIDVLALQGAVTSALVGQPRPLVSTLRTYVGDGFVGWKFADEATGTQHGVCMDIRDDPTTEAVAGYFIDQITETMNELSKEN